MKKNIGKAWLNKITMNSNFKKASELEKNRFSQILGNSIIYFF